MRASDGFYYLYATEDIRNLPIFRSKDMVEWEEIGTAFTDETRPDFLPGNKDVKEHAHLWAPEIRYVKGKYVLFYSLAQPLGQHRRLCRIRFSRRAVHAEGQGVRQP